MCENCYPKDFKPISNERVNLAIQLIKILYESEHGSCGGVGHIVFDDNNIDDNCIDFCLGEIDKYDSSEETKEASFIALTYFKRLTEDERESALFFIDKYGFYNIPLD